MRAVKVLLLSFMLLVATPLGLHAAFWLNRDHSSGGWAGGGWSSTHTLAPASQDSPAMIRVYSARTGHWKGIFATHSWIVLKPTGASAYERWDKVGWGQPVRRNGFAPDARWHGNEPHVIYELRGLRAERLIPKLRMAIARYPFRASGDYSVWPGPNSNTFIASVLAAAPELAVSLPPTAIGKDFPYDGRWVALTPSGTGFRVSLGGYIGLTLAWVEGVEINILGAVVGIDLRNPALKLPGFGRVGV